jgi:serine/threonine protein kinase
MSRSAGVDSEHIAVLNRLLSRLKKSDVPGPQLFRLENEFKMRLGEGGEGNVRGIAPSCAEAYRRTDNRILARWPVDIIAIKRHQKSIASNTQSGRFGFNKGSIANHFHAAEKEVRLLCPDRFRGNPNIVQLLGWGLCLDTIENPNSPCCGPLQMPLLVLERAKMNLWEFLQFELFSHKHNSSRPIILEEEGRSYVISTLESGTDQLRSPLALAPYFVRRFIGFEDDPYNVIRLLCIDIGHGLGSLHHEKFTHGDLKPQNVLVFQKGLKWTAKLCDFGHCRYHVDSDRSQNQTTPPSKERYWYGGTRSWQPPTRWIQNSQDADVLRRCDLYVYGLIVWSSFYLKGEPIAARSKDQARCDGEGFQKEWWWVPGNHRKLALHIDDVLNATVFDITDNLKPWAGNLKPWTLLYKNIRKDTFRARHVGKDKLVDVETRGRAWINIQQVPGSKKILTTLTLQQPLSRTEKSVYTTKRWWKRRAEQSTSPYIHNSSYNASAVPEGRSFPGSNSLGIEDSFSPASSTALAADDDHYRRETFQERHREEVGPVLKELHHLLSNLVVTKDHPYKIEVDLKLRSFAAANNQKLRTDLYCLARFRSRIPLEWWQHEAKSLKTNFIAMALQAIPALDICTLAWLCTGPVGRAEVQSLPAKFSIWRIIINPQFLDESERLDRFLLLLQFGARVDKEIVVPAKLNMGSGSKSITRWYFRSCRTATLPVVIQETCQRLHHMKHTGHESRNIEGGSESLPFPSDSVISELRSIDPSGRLGTLWQNSILMKENTAEGTGPTKNKKRATEMERCDSPNETSALLSSNEYDIKLYPGWKTRAGSGRGSEENEYYEDECTGSITLSKPKVSFIELRQIRMGVLMPNFGASCLLDLAPYTTKRMNLRDVRAINDATETRFPFYDDGWFMTEWETDRIRTDVLRGLRDIASFANRIDISNPGMILKQIFNLILLATSVGLLLAIIGLLFVLLIVLLPKYVATESAILNTAVGIGIVLFPLTIAFFILIFGALHIYHGRKYLLRN